MCAFEASLSNGTLLAIAALGTTVGWLLAQIAFNHHSLTGLAKWQGALGTALTRLLWSSIALSIADMQSTPRDIASSMLLYAAEHFGLSTARNLLVYCI